ncbi:hybrid sensor histidine kinase/response regulator transcription factor [Flavobacterium agrisoli]|uniref:histidine kinase n=1 Tax=Flavobacterium agrisoli TaxID=2793066 RepID=A0A934PKN1_9FLAO|nr:helix-turn-helix domain-containing protein [Flavobacterium agrisoli]MBK0369927.1 helix-turn-helix domain-containing protein [Flavobacterium agrisoli]
MRKKIVIFLISCFVCILYGSQLQAQNLFFEKITGQEIDPSTSIHGIAKDAVGFIWFGSWNGVYRYDGKTFDYFYHNPNDPNSLPNNRIRNIVSDAKFGLWFLTFDKKYSRYHYDTQFFSVVPKSQVPKLIIAKLDANSNVLNHDKIIKGKRYFLSGHLLTSLDLSTKKSIHYTANINLPGYLLDDYITTFFIDDEQLIWIGTRSGDIYKANPNRNPFTLHYSYVSKTETTKLATVRAILKVANQTWLGTDEGVLIYNNYGSLDAHHPFYRSNSQMKQVRTLVQDPNGAIWIGGVNGLECYDLKSNSTRAIINKNQAPNLETWSVFAMEVYEKNTLWVGLYNGLARIQLSDFNITYFDLESVMNNRSVMAIVCDKQKLWLGTEGNGVIGLSLDSKLDLIQKKTNADFSESIQKQMTGKIVYALYRDQKGLLWVGTTEGLYTLNTQIKNSNFKTFPLHLTSQNPYISAITDDAEGNLWIAHKEGISKIEKLSGEVYNYQNKDKFGSWRFLERAFYKDTNQNRLYFGSKNGFVSFDPQRIKTSINKHRLVLKTLYVSNQKVVPNDTLWGKPILTQSLSDTKKIILDYENSSFTIELASFNYFDTQKEVFEYQLEGYDDNWITTTSPHLVFHKIPPGKYTLKIRDSSSPKTSAVTYLAIQIQSPWYAPWWFKLVAFLFLVALVYWIVRQILYRSKLQNQIQLERLNAEQQERIAKEKLAFFTNISHDLKTPLTLIVDPIKQLQRQDISVQDKKLYFDIIQRNLHYLTKLIHQLLDFRKSELGKLTFNPTTQDFTLFIQNGLANFQWIAQQREIALCLEIKDSPLFAVSDFDKVEQILLNVLSNALQYTPNGGQVMVSVQLKEANETIELLVEDNGIGIAAAQLTRIFEPFHNEGPQPFHGHSSGIGLSLTHSLVHFLGGTISIESIEAKGTKVRISLPFVAASKPEKTIVDSFEESEMTALELDEEISAKDKNQPTILIVEDNPDVQLYLQTELQKHYTVIQEYNGKKGLESALQHIPDLIISDVMMPEMQGTELCKAVKNNEKTCHIPLILLTAKAAEAHQIEGYELGANAYVMKPFSVMVLQAQIKSLLDNRNAILSRLSEILTIQKLQDESPTLDKLFLSKVVELIQFHMGKTDFNPEVLAQELQISPRQLYRKLKAVSGCTVHEFITKVKMEQAAEWLKNATWSIAEIAYKLGFSEPSNFSRTFSKHFGCSPSKYLK